MICTIILVLYTYNVDIWIPTLSLIVLELRNKIEQIIRKIMGKELFDGNAMLFNKHLININIYGEYGIGHSTCWVLNNTKAKILSVDTSIEWIDKVKSKIKYHERIKIEWVDLGELGDWGKPTSYVNRKFIYNYLESIWLKTKNQNLY